MRRFSMIVAVAVGLASMAWAEEPVLSVNTNRILSLARQAVAESREDAVMEAIAFTDITYRLNAEQKETLRVGFRYSPESEVTNDEGKGTIRTVTTFQTITVDMDRDGKILSVSKGVASRQIRVESHAKHKAQRQNAREISASAFQALLSRNPESMRHTEFAGVQDGRAFLKVSTMSSLNKNRWLETYLVTDAAELPQEWLEKQRKEAQTSESRNENETIQPEDALYHE